MEEQKEFTPWECNQDWPLEEAEPIGDIMEEMEEACRCEDSDLTMVFFLKSAWKSKKHQNDAATRPPKQLTSGKHGYRIRKWVK